jgi:rRNA maturation endonuclease Nob1
MPFDELKFILLLLVVIGVLLVVFTGVPGRKTADKHDRVCRACRLAHPYFAHFCRKCGGKL